MDIWTPNPSGNAKFPNLHCWYGGAPNNEIVYYTVGSSSSLNAILSRENNPAILIYFVKF